MRTHGTALSDVRERRRAQDGRRERAMHGTRVRCIGPALQVRDPETDGDQEKPHDGGAFWGCQDYRAPESPACGQTQRLAAEPTGGTLPGGS